MTETTDEPMGGWPSLSDSAEAADSASDAFEAPTSPPDAALAPDALVVLAPDVLADSLGDYLRAWWIRIRSGESGALPIIVGWLVICIYFASTEPAFLTSTNIVNLFVQAVFIILLGMA